jgi:E3 ubiquitin-protein ligase EDD1
VKFFSKDSKEKEKEIKEKDFNTSDFKDSTTEEPVKLLADCRLLRKDELQVIVFIYHGYVSHGY